MTDERLINSLKALSGAFALGIQKLEDDLKSLNENPFHYKVLEDGTLFKNRDGTLIFLHPEAEMLTEPLVPGQMVRHRIQKMDFDRNIKQYKDSALIGKFFTVGRRETSSFAQKFDDTIYLIQAFTSDATTTPPTQRVTETVMTLDLFDDDLPLPGELCRIWVETV